MDSPRYSANANDGRWVWRWDPAFITSKIRVMHADPANLIAASLSIAAAYTAWTGLRHHQQTTQHQGAPEPQPTHQP